MAHPVSSVRRDPLIIGAGPAGAAAAIVLGQAGHRATLVERATGPTDKVCGDFLSEDSIDQYRALGVDPAALGAAPIRRLRLIHRGHIVETVLPFGAVGLSRRVLDATLLGQAKKRGVNLRAGETIRRLARGPDRWVAHCANGEQLSADTIFLATGKHELRDQQRRWAGPVAVGMKMYFSLRPTAARALEGTIALALFPGGYAGLQPVENGRAVLCIAVQQRQFQSRGGNWPSLLAAVGESQHFADLLADARPLLPRPLAVARIPYGYQSRKNGSDGLFRMGDQAAVIPSLTGDGLAIALHTGRAAADIWLAGGDAIDYHRRLNRTLRVQMRLARLLHGASLNTQARAFLVRVTYLFPGLLQYAANHTRLQA